MERNDHSRLMETLKAKFNICMLILSVCALYVFYICLTYNVCVYFILQIHYLWTLRLKSSFRGHRAPAFIVSLNSHPALNVSLF